MKNLSLTECQAVSGGNANEIVIVIPINFTGFINTFKTIVGPIAGGIGTQSGKILGFPLSIFVPNAA